MTETSAVKTPTSEKKAGRSSNVLTWVIVILMIALVAPAIGCGAFGFAFAMASSQPASTGTGPAVGVITVEGMIVSGSGGFSLSGSVAASDTIVELIHQADDDPNIKAIILRINSPGGGVVASDEIHHALKQVDKPIVVSMGELAASGGYYIAAPSDFIYATPHTLTGSIGVISQFIVAEELLDEVGISMETITSGTVKDFGSPYRDMTEEERAYWQTLTDEIYEGFIEIVADGRNMDKDTVRELADGRIYTGQQALALGLVDAIGYYDDAVDKAAELGGIQGDPRIVEFTPEAGFLEMLYGFQSSQHSALSPDFLRRLTTPSVEFRYPGP
ncbi:MAG: signal peptide peptidase SppA [Anaerolineae bacterium]|nr:signal peptide peptidase SppA [Anaerolineae bacterium]